MIQISITKHAKERFFERKKTEEIVLFFAQKAFHQGKRPTKEEFENIFKKGIYHDNGKYWTREYRKYFGFLWVFGGKSDYGNLQVYRLITVLPI